MRWLIGSLALLLTACGSSSPTAPSAPPVVVVAPPPSLPMFAIEIQPCPTAAAGIDLAFYLEMGCNSFDLPLQSVRRWTVAPKLYLKTVDESGAPIDALTLDTVQNAMSESAPAWTNGRFRVAVERGTETREGVSGWVTVKWPAVSADAQTCGRGLVAVDGGWIELNYKNTNCGCNGSAIRQLTARHELGHAFGYWHTDNPTDLMYVRQPECDARPSARELQAVAYQYRVQ